MWEIRTPDPVKLIFGILAADKDFLDAAVEFLQKEYGQIDLKSDVYDFNGTTYYKDQTGDSILKQFISFDKLINPDELAKIKIRANEIEKHFAQTGKSTPPRPVNLDPGIVEPSKLVLASTKNFSHRIYIGEGIYAELTLSFAMGKWKSFSYTFPDYKSERYHPFLSKVRQRIADQQRTIKESK